MDSKCGADLKQVGTLLALLEIRRVDPIFETDNFLRFCCFSKGMMIFRTNNLFNFEIATSESWKFLKSSAISSIAITALLLVPMEHAGAVTASTTDSCPNSANIVTGTTNGSWYNTVAPYELFDNARDAQFPYACSLNQLTTQSQNSIAPVITTRIIPSDFPSLYNVATRDRNELFVYGGEIDSQVGSYVAKIDATSLAELWRTDFRDTTTDPGVWAYPGVVAVAGDGNIYAISGRVLVKLDPQSGSILGSVNLPELSSSAGGTGAAYNGFVITPSGILIAKSMERGTCSGTTKVEQLNCVFINNLPSTLVAVNTQSMSILATSALPEASLGRIAAQADSSSGQTYIYIAGINRVFRYIYQNNALSDDKNWGPVTYRSSGQTPATSTGVMNGYVFLQTNFLQATSPLTVWAISISNASEAYTISPFGLSSSGFSQNLSKNSLDPASSMVYSNDTLVGQMAQLHFTPSQGFHVVWQQPEVTTDFTTLVSDTNNRQIVMPNFNGTADTVVWRQPSDGSIVATSPLLSTIKAEGTIVTPGFNGKFYYNSAAGQVIELSVAPSTVPSNLSYYPLPACRIIDTRNTSIPNLSVGSPTPFVVNSGGSTTNYTTQGGSPSGCGLPSDAKAVFFNFVAVNPNSSGYLQAWPFGTSVPTASVLNYANVSNLDIANGIILPVCNPSITTCTKDLNIQANQGSIQLVADVVGYFK